MTTGAERAAEEYTKKVLMVDFLEKTSSPERVSEYIKEDIKSAYLTGHAHALTPRKITKQKPKADEWVLFCDDIDFWYFGYRDEKGLFWTIQNGAETNKPDINFVYYFPLPPIPQREGEGK